MKSRSTLAIAVLWGGALLLLVWTAAHDGASLEDFYHFTNSVVFILILGGVIFTAWQVSLSAQQARAAADQNELAAKAETARVFLEIERRWSSPEITRSRELLWQFYVDAKSEGTVPSELIAARLKDWTASRPRKYQEFMQLVDLLEAIGVMVKNGYIEIDKIDELIGDFVVLCYEDLLPFIEETRRRYLAAGRSDAQAKEVFSKFEDLALSLRARQSVRH